MLVRRADLHLRESVAHIGGIQLVDPEGFRSIRLDRDYGHALVAIVVVEAHDALFVQLRDRTVVACEDDHKDRAFGIISEVVYLAVDTRQRKVRRRGADGKYGMRLGERKRR